MIQNDQVLQLVYKYIIYITYMLTVLYGLLIARDVHAFNRHGYGPETQRTKAQGAVGRDLGDPAPWAWVFLPGAYPL